MADYDGIAPFYDKIHANRRQMSSYVHHLIQGAHPSANTVLALACGTGSILKTLARHYHVTGLDISPKMLAVARKKLKKTEFYQADMCDFSLDARFDVITCIYASLNHVIDFDRWRALFERVKAHLKPGGVFIFDVMSETGLYNMVLNSPLHIQRFNHVSLGEITMAEDGSKTHWRARGYKRYGFHRKTPLYDVTVHQAAFSLERITAALQAHFDDIYVDDPEQSDVNEASEVFYFVCRAPLTSSLNTSS